MSGPPACVSLVNANREPPLNARISLGERGFDLYARDRLADETTGAAERLISRVPSLYRSVMQRVDGIAIIASADPAYDISHSEPTWPGWIFVSLPPPSPIAHVRLAEGIIHEAMHHNLTALEAVATLVTSEHRQFYSPWKHEERAASGVLHGFYVFTCLLTFFGQAVGTSDAMSRHVENRIREIRDEIRAIDREFFDTALTSAGRALCAALYDLVGG